jgi:hypothetical protein
MYIMKPATVSYWSSSGKGGTASWFSRSPIAVNPSTSQESASRRMICASSGAQGFPDQRAGQVVQRDQADDQRVFVDDHREILARRLELREDLGTRQPFRQDQHRPHQVVAGQRQRLAVSTGSGCPWNRRSR